MQSSPFALPGRWRSALEGLAARPLVLLCALLAVNALTHPYRGLFHDARLYAAQVTERAAPGSLSHDLYLRYGSQDSYSIFSALLAPLVQLAGLEPAFFLVYLLSKALYFLALVRLVTKLVDPLPAVLSLLFLAMAPLPVGGNEVIHLNESFLTPRIAASALVLFALERALSARVLQSLLLITTGMLVHPLMGFAGALVLALWAVFARLSWRWLLPLCALATVGAAVVVLCRPLGDRVFGHMDAEWYGVTLQVCFFADPAEWTVADWCRIACCSVSAVLLWRWRTELGPFLAALLVAGLLGVIGSFAAAGLQYRLLIQTTPYRTLWLLETLAIPFAFTVAARLWQTGRYGPFAALVLVVLVTADWNHAVTHPLLYVAGILPICIVWQRGLTRQPTHQDWVGRVSAAALVGGGAILLVIDGVMVVQFLRCQPTFEFDLHPIRVAQAAGDLLYKWPLLLVAALGLAAWLSRRRATVLVGVVLLVGAIGWQGVVAGLDASSTYQARYSVTQRHVQYVGRFLHARANEMGRRPSVYWTADLADIWFRGGACSYLNSVQLSGCAYNRGTAAEGRKRSRLVRNFEVMSLRRNPIPYPWWQRALEEFYEARSASLPSERDLFALCADESLDFIIVTERFAGLYRETDGVYYIYDCRQLRRMVSSR